MSQSHKSSAHHPWNNKVAVVTGAGSGIGRAVSKQLAKRGCHIALVDVNMAGLEETQALLQTYPGTWSVHQVDVTNQEQMENLPEQVIAIHGQVDMIFNNAGITIEKTFESLSIKEWELMMGINIWGVIYGCKFFLPHLKQRPEAFIVNTSSLAGFLGIPTQSSYCVTKAAVKALSESLWAELKSSNISVTSVHPGAIKTNIFNAAMEHSDDVEAAKKMFDLVEKFAMDVDKAAAKIVRAVEKKQQRVIIGMDSGAVEVLKRLFPVSIHSLFAWGFKQQKR
jgi:hypothetical protein